MREAELNPSGSLDSRTQPWIARNRALTNHRRYPDLTPDGKSQGVQLLLGHTKIESTVRYLGIEVDDALAIAEQVAV
jgi:hypothetical protein